MPIFIRHRVNQITELEGLDPRWGAEIDLRSDVTRPGKLHLSHDPWKQGDDLEAWLETFKKRKIQGPLLLNTKEDGLEETLGTFLRRFEISNYRFLDTPTPTLVKHVLSGHGEKFFVRLSHFEPLEMVERFRDRVEWVWADCFQTVPPDLSVIKTLATHFKICLVSPELHGAPFTEIDRFADLSPHVQAVCTKDPTAWMKRG